MTQEEIRRKRQELENKIAELEDKIQHVRLDLKHLQQQCKHPDGFAAMCMNEACGGCPDCGWRW
jgi:DNA-binding transcriptional MerR regulator